MKRFDRCKTGLFVSFEKLNFDQSSLKLISSGFQSQTQPLNNHKSGTQTQIHPIKYYISGD